MGLDGGSGGGHGGSDRRLATRGIGFRDDGERGAHRPQHLDLGLHGRVGLGARPFGRRQLVVEVGAGEQASLVEQVVVFVGHGAAVGE